MVRNFSAILALFFLGLSLSWASATTWTNTPLLPSHLINSAKGVAYGGATISDLRLITSTPTMAASATSSSQINLSWSGAVAPSGYMSQSYSVQRDGIEIARVAGPSYNNTDLVASKTYAYRV